MDSNHTILLAEIYQNGLIAFDNDEQSFFNWLNTNVPAIGNRKPIEMVASSIGREQVNEQLLRMEFSVI